MESESDIKYPSRGPCPYLVAYYNYLNVDDWRIDDVLRYQIEVDEDGSVIDDFIGNTSLAERDKSYFWFLRRAAKLLYEEKC